MPAFSITPFLAAAMLAFLALIVLRTESLSRTERILSLAVLAALASWVVFAVALSLQGVYRTDAFRSLYPTLWYPFIPAALCIVAAASPAYRRAVLKIADATPLHWFVWFEALRIGALGTLIKMFQHEFPLVLELAVGVPDLLVGLSAPFVAIWVARGQYARQALLLWHLIGAAVILANVPLLHLGMPGPHYLVTLQPDTSVLFEFPMVMAPTFAVPMLVAINLWMALYLWAFRDRAVAAHGLPDAPQTSELPTLESSTKGKLA